MDLKYSGSVIKETGLSLNTDNSEFIGPVGDIKINNIPVMTTTDIKFGAYNINWIFFLIAARRTWFRLSAKIMGTGKPNIKPQKLNLSVFIKISLKLGEVKKSLKCVKPTQSLPIIPFIGLKSLKAMIAPYIGIYLNTIVKMMAGTKNKYKA